MSRQLVVATDTGIVGQLQFESHDERFLFRYDDAWLARADAFPLSPHIPLGPHAPASGVMQRFLSNLLPEGRALDVASVVNQISKDNVFGLVHVLGREPVGGLGFLPVADDGAAPVQSREAVRRAIPHAELSERIRDRDTIPFPVWDRKVRLSVAGYQDKLQVLIEGEHIALADGALSSTHLLKPESRNMSTPHMVANEHFCMTLAARMGLPVAPVSLWRIPEPLLLVERFDRSVTRDPTTGLVHTVRRLHVIDACQALDAPVSYKYERNFGNNESVANIREGVSFATLFPLARQCEDPAHARALLVRWAMFHLLIGNSDAHGKNLSFFMRRSGLAPAPFYDLVSVNVYGAGVEQDMAMGYGDAFRIDDVTAFALADFAQRTGIPASYLSRDLRRMADSAMNAAAELAGSDMYIGEERMLVREIAGFVTRQAQHLQHVAPMIPAAFKSLL
ncbi:HipA domain-containing protein [Burkholderia sp. 3C]